eukprot:gene22545-biopygen8075
MARNDPLQGLSSLGRIDPTRKQERKGHLRVREGWGGVGCGAKANSFSLSSIPNEHSTSFINLDEGTGLFLGQLSESSDGRSDGGAIGGGQGPGTSGLGLVTALAEPDSDGLTLEGELAA